MEAHLCENCIFFDRCTPVEQQIDNYNKRCSNYIDFDFEIDDYLSVQRSVSWKKYVDDNWDYRLDK
jgi:hypothetical protein